MIFLPKPFSQHFQDHLEHSKKMLNLWSQLVTANLKQLEETQKSFLAATETKTPSPNALTEYLIDFTQRTLIYYDVLRKRGNQYLEHVDKGQPPVLIFKYKLLMDGREFEKPVNYGLVEIIPGPNIKIDKNKRPYVVVDPRAGHGSGISGFKDESQVGFALRAGHPVYVVIFFPHPEPHQTLADVAMAQERFLRCVAKRHPESKKPCIIGNCQGGWAVLSLAAAYPDIAGVLVINGAPLAYWAGENGKNPMRYIGGLLGGGWLAQLASDLGNSHFDGANLVMNFEIANPSVSYLKKYYKLFSEIDNEEQRFLEFERWWGGFSLLTAKEMRGIVENLFIGNKLVHGKISLGHSGNNLDLRDIHVPIIIFCSEGDNITPPQQALNWIADLYSDTLEIKLEGQVIVYLVHENIGHLGIFVSSSVAKKEHKQIIDLLNYIEHLPPGLYEMSLKEEGSEHHVILEERTIQDIVKVESAQKNKDEELFSLVRTVSDFNGMAYDFMLAPLIRTFANEYSAELLRQLHPLRMNNYIISDLNPFVGFLSSMVPIIKNNRISIDEENAFLQMQNNLFNASFNMLNSLRLFRDSYYELAFYHVYGTLHGWAPLDPFKDIFVHGIEEDQDHEIAQHIISSMAQGGVREAIIRILLLLIKTQGFTMGSHVSKSGEFIRNHELFANLNENEFRQIVQNQTIIVEYNSELAMESLSQLMTLPEQVTLVLSTIDSILDAMAITRSPLIEKMLQQIKDVLNQS